MKRTTQIIACVLRTTALAAFVLFLADTPVMAQDGGTAVSDSEFMDSVLVRPWDGPYGGVPPWNLVQADRFIPALKTTMEMARKEIDEIASNTEPATFANTFIPLENSGRALTRVINMFGVHASNLNVGPMPDIQKTVMPMLAEYEDSMTQNEALFARIAAVYESDEMDSLSVAQKRLVDDQYKTFVRKGAKLSTDDKKALSQINQRLATLFANFSQNVLDDEQNYVTWIEDEADLAGLPESVISGMASAAKSRDKEGQWAITNTRSSMEPFLSNSENRELREKVWRTYYDRGDNGDEKDNNAIIAEILKLRAKRAKLLGYETHAHWRLEPQMAKDPQNAMDLMLKVWPKAVARVKEEVADMQKIADEEGANITIEPWDYRFYAEKVREAKYDLDLNEVKPYMQLEKLREAMMWCSTELYGLNYKPVTGVPVFHPDVRVWEVLDKDGAHIGLWYFDPYAREGKRSGAWMTDYRAQENMNGKAVSTIVSNNSNFVKGEPGEPVLISWDDATTLFHEFGHAIHGLLSKVEYPSQSGTSVARDYVEFPSQVNEHWLSTPEVLNKFCVHFETGEPLPKELVDKIEKAATFNQGFSTVEYLGSALIDMKLHLAGDVDIDPDAFEKKTLAELGMPSEICMRHRTPQFSHVFADDGYSAGYYSYLWSDALTADAAEKFEEVGSYFNKEVAQSLHDNVFSVGDTIDPAEGFRRFRGRDVDTSALLRKRGFPVD
jgi:peptidyl-dipeptidase Dcp